MPLTSPEEFDKLMEDDACAHRIVGGAVKAIAPLMDDQLAIAILVCALGLLGRYTYRTPDEYTSFVLTVTALLADAPDELAGLLDKARNPTGQKH